MLRNKLGMLIVALGIACNDSFEWNLINKLTKMYTGP